MFTGGASDEAWIMRTNELGVFEFKESGEVVASLLQPVTSAVAMPCMMYLQKEYKHMGWFIRF